MAYGSNPGMDNPGEALDTGGQPEGEMRDESMHEGMEHKGMGSLYLSKEMLPEGMAEDLKPGEILEFKVVGTDKDGDVEVTYNTGKEGDGGGKDDWENDLRHEMSARTPEEAA